MPTGVWLILSIESKLGCLLWKGRKNLNFKTTTWIKIWKKKSHMRLNLVLSSSIFVLIYNIKPFKSLQFQSNKNIWRNSANSILKWPHCEVQSCKLNAPAWSLNKITFWLQLKCCPKLLAMPWGKSMRVI